MIAASTVVDIASIDIGAMELWEQFRMFLLMKEVYTACTVAAFLFLEENIMV